MQKDKLNLDSYDYIVIGAGSAGCVVASRLSEDPNISVCLLEAGGPDKSVFIRAPLGGVVMLPTKINNWAFETTPQKGLNGRRGYQPRGKTLGGSSSTNAMLYVRGNKWDYDHWQSLGNDGWSYKDVLPYFKKSEHNAYFNDGFHGENGTLNVSNPPEPNKLNRCFMDSCVQHNIPETADYNGETQEGCFLYQRTIKNGERCSAAKAFITPNLNRPNLTIITHAQTEKVIFKEKTAVGIKYKKSGKCFAIKCTKEVIVSAGAFASPQLLMLSGIGPIQHLRSHNIKVIKDVPGMGENLQDHIDYIQSFKILNKKDTFGLSFMEFARMLKAIFEWRKYRTGKITSTVAESGAFFKSDDSITVPDLQLVWVAGIVDNHARKLHWGHGFSCHLSLLRPKSKGTVRLASSDIKDAPLINPDFFKDPDDMEIMLKGAQKMHSILLGKPFDHIRGQMLYPIEQFNEMQLEQDIRNRADTQYHPVGTCKMAPKNDPMAVVDNQLKIHGLKNIRVADASIMPTLIGGNTNATSIMIGEKAADMIRADLGN